MVNYVLFISAGAAAAAPWCTPGMEGGWWRRRSENISQNPRTAAPARAALRGYQQLINWGFQQTYIQPESIQSKEYAPGIWYMGEDINGIAILALNILIVIIIAKKSSWFSPRILQATLWFWFWSAMPDVQSPWWDVWADLTSAEMKECVSATWLAEVKFWCKYSLRAAATPPPPSLTSTGGPSTKVSKTLSNYVIWAFAAKLQFFPVKKHVSKVYWVDIIMLKTLRILGPWDTLWSLTKINQGGYQHPNLFLVPQNLPEEGCQCAPSP